MGGESALWEKKKNRPRILNTAIGRQEQRQKETVGGKQKFFKCQDSSFSLHLN